MNNLKLVHKKLEYLFEERFKIESVDDGEDICDSDFSKILEFIHDEIRDLQLTIFRANYDEMFQLKTNHKEN